MSDQTHPDILTKENFWNSLYEKYPKEMKVFCEWIDEYKKRVKWGELFGENLENFTPGYHDAPKFHEIPVAMQIGIFFQFTTETDVGQNDKPMFSFGSEPSTMNEFIDSINWWFQSLYTDEFGDPK